MDYADRKILEHNLALPIAKAVQKWMDENGVRDNVIVGAEVSTPSCYVDSDGRPHTGPLVVCNVRIVDDEDEDEF